VPSVTWGSPSFWKYICLLIINGMSSNKLGNSFVRKTSYVFPVKLLSKTKGPINLLPSKPHHTFTENLLWNLVTLVSCGLSWDHVRRFRELFIPSRVKDASSVNKMTLNRWGQLLILQSQCALDSAVDWRTGMRSVRVARHAKQVQYMEPQEDHVFLSPLSP